MKPWKLNALHVTTTLVTVTGVVYFCLKYLARNDDPFALVNHPWQPAMLKWHIFLAPLLILAFGIFLEAHVFGKLSARLTTNRLSGLASLISFLAMTLSGYGLQVVTSETMRSLSLVLHLGSSAVFVAAYVAHVILSVRLKRKENVQRAHPDQLADPVAGPAILNRRRRAGSAGR